MAMAAGTCSVNSVCWEAHIAGSDSMRSHSRNVGGRRAPTMPCPRAVLYHFAPVQPKQRVRGHTGSPLICFLELLLRMFLLESLNERRRRGEHIEREMRASGGSGQHGVKRRHHLCALTDGLRRRV